GQAWMAVGSLPRVECGGDLALEVGAVGRPGEVSALPRVGREVVELDLGSRPHVVVAHAGAGRTLLDVERQAKQRAGLGVPDVLPPARPDRSDRVVAVVVRLLGEDLGPPGILLAAEPGRVAATVHRQLTRGAR